MRRTEALLIGAIALTLTGGTCDRYYGLRRHVRLASTPDSACIREALQAAGVGTITHRCDTSTDTGQLTDYFSLNSDAMHESVTLAIPHTPGATSEAHFYWGQLNHRPTRDQTTRIRRIMDSAYAAAQTHCGLPDATHVKEECGWCD